MSDPAGHTFLFADLAGFTALTEAHGDEEAVELAVEFGECVRELLAEHGAEEVKAIGDAVMLRCDHESAAIELGLRIVEAVRSRQRFPAVRVGMHTGPAIERGGDWFGATVNLAARVCGIAGGNEVLLTEETRKAVRPLEAIDLHRHGEQRFRNIRKAVYLYRAVREGAEREGSPIDPVCRMAVDPGQAAGKLTYEDREYHFCSLDCARAFAAAAEEYAGRGEEGR